VTTVSVVSETHVSSLGEGPYWDDKNQLLYHVDSLGSAFYQVNPNTGEVQKRTVPDAVVSIIIPYQNEDGKFIISRGNTLLKLDWATGETELLVELDANPDGFERFNDGKCDAQGRLFIGTVLEIEGGGVVPEGGSLYRLDFDSATSTHSFTKMATGFTISNGMSWSNNGATKFYLNDSEGCKVYSFDYDLSTGSLCKLNVLTWLTFLTYLSHRTLTTYYLILSPF
jgi:sugar lactone lactonase YvrE